MSNVIEFKPKSKSSSFQRIDELFTVTLWIGTDDEYEIDMLTHEEYSDHEIFIGLGCLFLKFGQEHGLIENQDDE